MDRIFLITALLYAIVGMALGKVMAITQDHGQLVAHAHILLVGFVVSFIYALCHKLWLGNDVGLLAKAQCALHQIGALLMSVGLFLMYGGYVPMEKIGPVLGAGSALVLLATVLMLVMFLLPAKANVDKA